MTSVRHVNGPRLSRSPTADPGASFTLFCYCKTASYGSDYRSTFSWDNGANQFLVYQVSGSEFGNTSMMVQVYANGSTDEVEVLSGSDTAWTFMCIQHTGGTNVYRVGYRKDSGSTLTFVDLNAGSEIDAIGTIFIGSDGAAEHAADASTRHHGLYASAIGDSACQALSDSLAAPGGSPEVYLDLDSPTNAGVNAGSGSNYTVTGTLQTDSTEPSLSSSQTLQPGVQTISISQPAPTANPGGIALQPGLQTITITQQAPVVSQGALTLQPAAQSIAITQQTPAGVVWDFSVAPGLQTISISQPAPSTNPLSEDHWSIHASGRYYVNDFGEPVFEHGDTAWSMLVQLDLTDTIAYLDWCTTQGINSISCNLIEHQFSDQSPASKNKNGDEPWGPSGTPFVDDENEDYFDHVRAVFAAARDRHIQVKLWHTYLGAGGGGEGWWSDLTSASSAQQTAWGEYVGALCLPFPNILYTDGGDYDPGTYAEIDRVHDGITSVDGYHSIFGYHGGRGENGWETGSAGQTQWLCYPEVPLGSGTYPDMLAGYNQGTHRPVTFDEGYYQDNSHSSILALRAQDWHAVMSGAAGHRWGDGDRWSFSPTAGQDPTGDTWQQSLTHDYTVQMFYLQQFLRCRRWWLVSPDQTSTFLTGGEGSAGWSNQRTATYDASTGLWGAVYIPDGSSGGSVTIDRTEMAGTFVAHWFNPRDGSYTIIGTTHANTGTENFTAPDTNDWVLVLDVDFPTLLAPAVQTVSISQPAPTVAHGSSQTLQPGLLTVTISQPAPNAVPGAVSVAPGLQTVAIALEDPLALNGGVALQPPALPVGIAQPAPSLAFGGVVVQPGVLAISVAQQALQAVPGGLTLSPALQTVAVTLLAHALELGEATLSPPALAVALALQAPEVVKLLQILEPAEQTVVLTQVALAVVAAGEFTGGITNVGKFRAGGGFITSVGAWEDT